jgi:hypothetical protein
MRDLEPGTLARCRVMTVALSGKILKFRDSQSQLSDFRPPQHIASCFGPPHRRLSCRSQGAGVAGFHLSWSNSPDWAEHCRLIRAPWTFCCTNQMTQKKVSDETASRQYQQPATAGPTCTGSFLRKPAGAIRNQTSQSDTSIIQSDNLIDRNHTSQSLEATRNDKNGDEIMSWIIPSGP